jgi:hypothetical protein
MAIDYDEKQNTTNQPTSWQNNSTSYVYPDAYGQKRSGRDEQAAKKPRSAARTLGIVALVLSITVLFSALTGTAVYLLTRQTAPTTAQTTEPARQARRRRPRASNRRQAVR